ncbi:MAG: hypothetical protein ACD_5C00114G0005 [uncultured bacterium]|nr:MAG: hypothetical protein ACD_5C00114G0005 [uncultured bacterium]
MVIKIVKDEEEQQISLLIDGEGPDFTLRKDGRRTIVATREIITEKIPGWHTVVKDWCGLSIYNARSSRKDIIEKIKELFNCKIVLE